MRGGLTKHYLNIIKDGALKLSLSLKALEQPNIQKYFSISGVTRGPLSDEFSDSYLCVHIRRGDYLNVASHLVKDFEFVDLAKQFSGLVKNIAVVSDSPIDETIRIAIAEGFEQAKFFDDIDAFSAHLIMRRSRILICSNSQFSLVSALLSSSALVVLPKQWFGDKDRAIEVPIHEACSFQLLNFRRA